MPMTAIAYIFIGILQPMREDIRKKFARHLKALRTRRGYSVLELARRSLVSRQHIRDLELDVPQKRVTIVTLEKLAQGLRLPLWKLLQFKD